MQAIGRSAFGWVWGAWAIGPRSHLWRCVAARLLVHANKLKKFAPMEIYGLSPAAHANKQK